MTDFQSSSMLDTLAAALANANRFDETIERAETALKVDGSIPDKDRKANKARLVLYRSKKPFRESSD